MSVLTDAPRWTCLIRDLCSGRGFCCCKLAFPRSVLNCQLFSPGSHHFSPHIKKKPTFVSMMQNQSANAWLLPARRRSSASTPSSPCQSCLIFMYLTLNRCNWLSSILSSTGSLLLCREWEDNSLSRPNAAGNKWNLCTEWRRLSESFNWTRSLKWVTKAHCNSCHDLLCCCWSKRNTVASKCLEYVSFSPTWCVLDPLEHLLATAQKTGVTSFYTRTFP